VRPARRIVVAEADPATRGLLQEWLGAEGWSVVDEAALGSGTGDEANPVALAIVDVPRPRGGGDDTIRRVRARMADVPILAVSPTFMPNIQPCGACARLLGVQRVLPKPLVREELVAAVDAVVGPSR
jgi:DNA-binding response OmpR family regulator